MYDKNGLRIGFTNVTCPSAIQVEPKKSAKKTKSVKTAKTATVKEHDFKLSKSETNLLDFLHSGHLIYFPSLEIKFHNSSFLIKHTITNLLNA